MQNGQNNKHPVNTIFTIKTDQLIDTIIPLRNTMIGASGWLSQSMGLKLQFYFPIYLYIFVDTGICTEDIERFKQSLRIQSFTFFHSVFFSLQLVLDFSAKVIYLKNKVL